MPTNNDGEREVGRTQPEFSLGERMATMEAKLAAIDANLSERKTEQKELFGEQIKSVRDDITGKDKAQKEAVTKSEGTATSAATALATELRQYREATDGRLGGIGETREPSHRASPTGGPRSGTPKSAVAYPMRGEEGGAWPGEGR
jgi:hypothetical protein